MVMRPLGLAQHGWQNTPSGVLENMAGASDQVFVNTMGGKTILLRIQTDDKVAKLKRLLENKAETKEGEQTFSCAGKLLEDDRSFSDYNIWEGTTIFAATRLRGGAARTRQEELEEEAELYATLAFRKKKTTDFIDAETENCLLCERPPKKF